MNFIYFSDKGRLKHSTIDDLYATSCGTDVIYIFSDFDTNLDTDYSVTLMFRRADGVMIGEVECYREPIPVYNPAAQKEMPAFSFVLQNDVLGVPGPLQITARYYTTYVYEISGETKEVCRATGMVVATVHDAVPNYAAMKSTVAANLNRKIDSYINTPNKPILLYQADGFLTITGTGEIPIDNISNYKFIMLEWAETSIPTTTTRLSIFSLGSVSEDVGFFSSNTGPNIFFKKFFVSKVANGIKLSFVEDISIFNGGEITVENANIYIKAVYAL